MLIFVEIKTFEYNQLIQLVKKRKSGFYRVLFDKVYFPKNAQKRQAFIVLTSLISSRPAPTVSAAEEIRNDCFLHNTSETGEISIWANVVFYNQRSKKTRVNCIAIV